MLSSSPGDHFGTSECGGWGAIPFPIRQFPPPPPPPSGPLRPHGQPPHLCARQPTHLPGPPALSLSMALHPPHPDFFQKGPALPFLEQTSLSSLGPSSNVTLSPAAPRHLWTPQAFTHVSEPYLEKHCLLPLTWRVSWAPASPRANLRADARPDPHPLCSGMESRCMQRMAAHGPCLG